MRFIVDNPQDDGLCADCGAAALYWWAGSGYCSTHHQEHSTNPMALSKTPCTDSAHNHRTLYVDHMVQVTQCWTTGIVWTDPTSPYRGFKISYGFDLLSPRFEWINR